MGTQINRVLERFSGRATKYSGSSWAFAIATALIVVWLATGPLFGFSDTWQLVINTGTTIVTFLMVFLIQRAQNKENEAVQLKLNELVAAVRGASNRLIDLEEWSEEELSELHKHYRHWHICRAWTRISTDLSPSTLLNSATMRRNRLQINLPRERYETRSCICVTPSILAQFAQQNSAPVLPSTPCPMMRQEQ
jgi:low affinity Fe/Cu permease